MFKACGYKVVVTDLVTDQSKTIALFDYKDQALNYAHDADDAQGGDIFDRRFFYTVKESL